MAKKDELAFEGGVESASSKPNNSEKLKALQAAMDKIEKNFGKGSIMKMGDDHVEEVEVIPTGSIALNAALGVGGYPKGRIIEIYGPESSGKTTLAIHAIAEAQKNGGIAAFIDAEHAFDRFYAAKLGVDIDNLWISQPDNGEQALEIAEQLIRSSAIDIIVIDSVAALTPKAEIEGDMGDNKVGLQARTLDVAGFAQADFGYQQDQYHVYFHQPVAREDRRNVWQSRNYYRRKCLEVLCFRTFGYPPYLPIERRGRCNRKPGACESGEEQGRSSFPQGRV